MRAIGAACSCAAVLIPSCRSATSPMGFVKSPADGDAVFSCQMAPHLLRIRLPLSRYQKSIHDGGRVGESGVALGVAPEISIFWLGEL